MWRDAGNAARPFHRNLVARFFAFDKCTSVCFYFVFFYRHLLDIWTFQRHFITPSTNEEEFLRLVLDIEIVSLTLTFLFRISIGNTICKLKITFPSKTKTNPKKSRIIKGKRISKRQQTSDWWVCCVLVEIWAASRRADQRGSTKRPSWRCAIIAPSWSSGDSSFVRRQLFPSP